MRTLLPLLFLLALLGAPSPVHCLEAEGGCDGPGTAPGMASCHDRAPASLPDCASCTDVPAPEESLTHTSRQGQNQAAPAAFIANHIGIAATRDGFRRFRRVDALSRTPALIRTTVLLI